MSDPSYEVHCVTGAVLTHDVMYTGFKTAPVTQWALPKRGRCVLSYSDDKDKDNVLKRPNICYIFEKQTRPDQTRQTRPDQTLSDIPIIACFRSQTADHLAPAVPLHPHFTVPGLRSAVVLCNAPSQMIWHLRLHPPTGPHWTVSDWGLWPPSLGLLLLPWAPTVHLKFPYFALLGKVQTLKKQKSETPPTPCRSERKTICTNE